MGKGFLLLGVKERVNDENAEASLSSDLIYRGGYLAKALRLS